MVNLYYHVGRLGAESDSLDSSLGRYRIWSSKGEDGTAPITTLRRRNMASSKQFKLKKTLAGMKKRNPSGARSHKIVQELIDRRTSSQRNYDAPEPGDFTDLESNVIGTTYESDSLEALDDIKLGSSRYLKGVSFDFVSIKGQSNTYAVRVSSFYTDEGMHLIRGFLMNYLNDIRNKSRKKIKNRYKDLDNAVRENEKGETQGIKIDGGPVHINLNGKVNLFAKYPGLSGMLKRRDQVTSEAVLRIEKYAQFSPINQWVRETTPDYNGFIGGMFKIMADVNNELLEKSQKRGAMNVGHGTKIRGEHPPMGDRLFCPESAPKIMERAMALSSR